MNKKILITGSNRGLGLEFVRQLSLKGADIIACCREPDQAIELAELADRYKNIAIYPLDITDDRQIIELAQQLRDVALDWIINNAGISGAQGVSLGNIDRNNFLHVLNVNAVSPLKISDSFLPNLLKGKDKLIACISSQMGSISDNIIGRSYAYRTSKAALNCAFRSFAIDVQKLDIKIILLHPGWVQTDMGGPEATTDVQTSISGMLEVIENRKDSSHAEAIYSFNGQKINW